MRPRLGAVALGASAIALASCGEQRTFGADELVAELNERGASIELGESLPAADEGTEIFAVEVAAADEHAPAERAEPAGEEAHAHGGGSLYVLPDEEAALERYRDCEQAATLICFRAANAFIGLEDGVEPRALSRVEAAVQGLGEEG